MSKYKFMNGKELANFILSKDRDVEFSFATEWPEDVAEEDLV